MNYRPEIDGLRAVAVFPVVFFHLGWSIFDGGYIGVDIFFVISGYLIATLIIKEIEDGSFSLINFYERRVRRIFPVLFLVTLTTAIFGWFLLLPPDFKSLSQSIFSSSIFLSNIYFWLTNPYFSPPADLQPLLHTWSLSVEEQFYLFFPILILLCLKISFNFFVVVISLFFFSSFLSLFLLEIEPSSWKFYLIISRAWELIIGIYAAILLNEKKALGSKIISELGSAVGFSLLLISLILFDHNLDHPSLWTLIPVLGTFLVIVFCNQKTKIYKILSFKPLVSIGLISYSLYLWHFPIISFTKYAQFQELNFIQTVIIFTISIIISYISWRFFERKFRDKKIIDRRFIFKFAALGSVFLVSIGLLGHFNNGFDERLSKQEQEILRIKNLDQFNQQLRTGTCFLEEEDSIQSFDSSCFSGEILLWGDSHAAALFHGLNEIQPITQLTSSGCPPILDISLSDNNVCAFLNDQIFTSIKENKYKLIILHANWVRHGYGDYIESFKDTLQQISTSREDAKIIVVGNTPQWFNSLPKYLVFNAISIQDIKKNSGFIQTHLEKQVVSDELIKDSLDEIDNENIQFISILDEYCFNSACLGIDPEGNNELLFWDYGHLTERGSSTYARHIFK